MNKSVLIWILSLTFAVSIFGKTPKPAKDYTELKGCRYLQHQWNDGDSFHIKTAEGKEVIIRLYFVDTPESDTSFPERIAVQTAYFGVTPDESLKLGKEAAKFTEQSLAGEFTVYTRWKDALGRSKLRRYYAFVKIGEVYLQDLLIKNGLARIYGTRTPLPDGKDSRAYLNYLDSLENEAKAARRGGWKTLPK